MPLLPLIITPGLHMLCRAIIPATATSSLGRHGLLLLPAVSYLVFAFGGVVDVLVTQKALLAQRSVIREWLLD